MINKRKVLVAAVILVVIAAVGAAPRLDAEVTLAYSESTLGTTFIDVKLSNHGTVSVSGIYITITVLDPEDNLIAEGNFTTSEVHPFSEKNFDAMRFRCDQTQRYTIILEIELDAQGKTYTGEDTYTVGEAMNYRFTHSLSEWFP